MEFVVVTVDFHFKFLSEREHGDKQCTVGLRILDSAVQGSKFSCAFNEPPTPHTHTHSTGLSILISDFRFFVRSYLEKKNNPFGDVNFIKDKDVNYNISIPVSEYCFSLCGRWVLFLYAIAGDTIERASVAAGHSIF